MAVTGGVSPSRNRKRDLRGQFYTRLGLEGDECFFTTTVL